MHLDKKQKKHLRGLAHHLKAVIQIGSAGATPMLKAELNQTLEHHELVKVKIRASNRAEREKLLADIVTGTDAALVTRIGNIAVLYRRNKEKPGIEIPGG
ncbi:MAG: ribosome assembly RNA-binding protein YhbY [Gammaproteobacteria bacterium]|nr:ribosome assembly RNA-binding protein YhbY [Gammaproteobacteria bacterium]